MPKPYMALKETMIRAAVNNHGTLKKKTAREICKIDTNKSSQLFEYFVHSGWIARA
jgi:transcriptional adapter 2-alpha